jgi:hypothetical protein
VHHAIVRPTPPAERRGAIALHARGHERLIAVRLSGEEPSVSRRHERPRGAFPFPADPAAPRVGPIGPRSQAGTSAGAASGIVNHFFSNVSSSINFGYRRPGSTVTAKTSCTPDSNRKSATTTVF